MKMTLHCWSVSRRHPQKATLSHGSSRKYSRSNLYISSGGSVHVCVYIPLLVSSFHLLKNREELGSNVQQNTVFQANRFRYRFTLEFPEMSPALQVLSIWRPYKDTNVAVLMQSTSRKESKCSLSNQESHHRNHVV